jgi:hypothetical protein
MLQHKAKKKKKRKRILFHLTLTKMRAAGDNFFFFLKKQSIFIYKKGLSRPGLSAKHTRVLENEANTNSTSHI